VLALSLSGVLAGANDRVEIAARCSSRLRRPVRDACLPRSSNNAEACARCAFRASERGDDRRRLGGPRCSCRLAPALRIRPAESAASHAKQASPMSGVCEHAFVAAQAASMRSSSAPSSSRTSSWLGRWPPSCRRCTYQRLQRGPGEGRRASLNSNIRMTTPGSTWIRRERSGSCVGG
jgi:hypothetical protein